MRPYRFGPSWRAVLQNYFLRLDLIGVQPKRAFEQPPTPPAMVAPDGYRVHVGEWEWIVKPMVRDYFRAMLRVDRYDEPILQQFLIVDPYDLKIGMDELTRKIEDAMHAALTQVREIEEHAAR